MDDPLIFFSGLAAGLGIIVAVGAQNAYLLRQGLRRGHVGPLAGLCIAADVVLIGLAVRGVGAVVTAWPGFLTVAAWAGGLFLIAYGAMAAHRAIRPRGSLTAGLGGTTSLRRALATMGAVTFLNPHLYLDVVLLGTLANSQGADGRWWMYGGFIAASAAWFLVLGYGAGRLAPLFSRPRSWQVLDALIAVVMVGLGVSLIVGG